MGSIDEKNRVRKSHASVPLIFFGPQPSNTVFISSTSFLFLFLKVSPLLKVIRYLNKRVN
jgi:hypothetical protein